MHMSDDQERHAIYDTDGCDAISLFPFCRGDIILRADNLDLWIKMTDCLTLIPPIIGQTGK